MSKEKNMGNVLLNEGNEDIKIIYSDNKFNLTLYMTYRGDQLQLVRYQCSEDNKKEIDFIEGYSTLMRSMFIDDYINNDVSLYKDRLGEEFSFEGYALSQKIVEEFFNRFFC